MIAPKPLPIKLTERRKEDCSVTVCIAAIYDRSGVFSAADRMITAGDVQFEPTVEKVRYLTNSCLVMFAGDATLQSEIIQSAQIEIGEKIRRAPDTWLTIKSMAETYKQQMDATVLARSERRVLVPLGLTRESFLMRQAEFSDVFVRDVSKELLNYEAPSVAGIVCGIDTTGPHIYVVDNASLSCNDHVGFAAIGAGYWHANSQMMSFSHSPQSGLADTLLNVFSSKKRAEIAPGVGKATDMYIVTSLGSSNTLRDSVAQELEKRYEDERRRQQRVANTSRQKINAFVQGILDEPAAQSQAELPANTEPVPPAAEKEE